MIRAVVFDLGKVLVDFDYAIAARNLAARARLTPDEIATHFGAVPLLIEYETGRLTSGQFHQRVCALTGYCGSLEEFAGCFGDIFSEIWPMIQLQDALRAGGMPTYVFSNTNELAVRHIRKRFPFFANFNGYILSFEHGAMKPSPPLYEVVERVTGLGGGEILYIDDRPENAEAGAGRGWKVIVHTSPESTISRCRDLGLPTTKKTSGPQCR